MPRPEGLTLNAAESAALIEWRDARPGSTEDLAAVVGVSRQHLSRFLNASGSLAREPLYALLRVLRGESDWHLARLDVVAGPEIQSAIRSIRGFRMSETPRAGRGRVTAASIA